MANSPGKSTVARALLSELKPLLPEMRSLHLDDFRAFSLEGKQRVVDDSGRRDWESPTNIAWQSFQSAIDRAVTEISCEVCEDLCVSALCAFFIFCRPTAAFETLR